MYERIDARDLGEMALPLSRRDGGGVFFARVCGWGDAVSGGVAAFCEAARRKGDVVEGPFGNPDERQLSRLSTAIGEGFEPTEAFLAGALERWMPGMGEGSRRAFAQALRAELDAQGRAGKPPSAQRNLCLKLLCWLRDRFAQTAAHLGEDDPPRVLAAPAAITAHELVMLRLLNGLGADVLLLEPAGDAAYQRHDPDSRHSQLLVPEGAPFPEGFSLKRFCEAAVPASPPTPAPPSPGRPRLTLETHVRGVGGHEVAAPRLTLDPTAKPGSPAPRLTLDPAAKPGAPAPRLTLGPSGKPGSPAPTAPRMTPDPPGKAGAPAPQPRSRRQEIDPMAYFEAPTLSPCTNTWMREADYAQILTPPAQRGDDPRRFCNALIRLRGVRDRSTYMSELFRFYQRFRATGRRLLVVDGPIPRPEPDEVAAIRRRNYRSAGEMIVDLSGNLPACASAELQKLMRRAFAEMVQSAQADEPQLGRLLISAVYLLCWIRRYQSALFQGYRAGDVSGFFLMGGCRDAREALFARFLSRLPVDVLLIAPDLNRPCAFSDDWLLELSGPESLSAAKFPRDAGSLQADTVAARAEDDLAGMLYEDSGLYRSHQFARADALTLRTTCDELFMLWSAELKYRSGFSAAGGVVTMPVLYARIAGVEGGKTDAYWQRIRGLLGKDTFLAPRMPMIPPGAPNPFQPLALKALRGGRLNREALKSDSRYPFGLVREAVQEHMLDKLQLMLDRRLIKGTFQSGVEYTVVATVLNLDKALLRMLQSFDFTLVNPKLVCVSAGDGGASLEDAILIAFLNLVGFDVALFVPTGYQTVERYLNDGLPVEHQLGEYLYDLAVPELTPLPPPKPRSWLDHLFRRG